ncbi:MAG: hypothetical protein IK051_02285 [Rhodocyclaceae bacterium]|nr:hypothetical protein [Rhodocyclaceae bacterium]
MLSSTFPLRLGVAVPHFASAGAASTCVPAASASAAAVRRPPFSHTPPCEHARASSPILPAESSAADDAPSEQDNAATDAAE